MTCFVTVGWEHPQILQCWKTLRWETLPRQRKHVANWKKLFKFITLSPNGECFLKKNNKGPEFHFLWIMIVSSSSPLWQGSSLSLKIKGVSHVCAKKFIILQLETKSQMLGSVFWTYFKMTKKWNPGQGHADRNTFRSPQPVLLSSTTTWGQCAIISKDCWEEQTLFLPPNPSPFK